MVTGALAMAPGGKRDRKRILRRKLHCPFKQFDRFSLGSRFDKERTGQRLHRKLPGAELFRLHMAGPLHLCGANGAFHGARYALCHAFLEGKGVLDLAVPSVGPQMLTGRRVG
jgi:hypothetical protein